MEAKIVSTFDHQGDMFIQNLFDREPMRRASKTGLVIVVTLGLAALALVVGMWKPSRAPAASAADILGSYQPQTTYPALVIRYPLNDALFPPEIVPPTFNWDDSRSGADTWLISIQFTNWQDRLNFFARVSEWIPATRAWETIKRRAGDGPAMVTILGLKQSSPLKIISAGHVRIRTAKDEVGAPLFYREVNLPFAEAVKDPSRIRWRFGLISSPRPPPVVLEHLPVCGNCHSFSRDGALLGMDVDYANSKGSYVMTPTAPHMRLVTSDIITWDDYRREDGELTFGLLSQVSPDGKVVISTVKDKSVFVPRPTLAFSQLFFPIKGILAYYRRQTRTFAPLPGADNPEYVQSNPTWSPDGKYIVFARSKAYDLQSTSGRGKVLLSPEECREFVKDGKPFIFDLYRIPFNDGQGGKPEPLEGAANDGLSNYFPKYSPDGKWIVFCKAKSYMLLQPDSQLYIVPAQGGKAQRLQCNTAHMNSWHSWSPCGKWLVFSSKANSPYTQLWITHIDEQGNSTPPVVLANLTAPGRAANIPEFVNLKPGAITRIHEQFLNDYSYERAGNEFFKRNDPDSAIQQYRKALQLNPNNVNAHQKLGFLLYHVKHQYKEGMTHSAEALRLDANNGFAHCDLGMALLHQGQSEPAIGHLLTALRLIPAGQTKQYDHAEMRYNLAHACLQEGKYQAGADQLLEVIRLDPNNADAYYLLALAQASQGMIDEPLQHYSKAIALNPGIDTSVNLHDLLGINYAKAGQLTEAILSAERALRLARAAGNHSQARTIEARLEQYRRKRRP